MFIEEIIQFVTGSGPWLFKSYVPIPGKDGELLQSFSNQLHYNQNNLTEKQGTLAVRLLSKHKDIIRQTLPDIDTHLATPQWQKPFRVLSKYKKISILRDSKNSRICVEFPYIEELVEMMRKRNQEVHPVHKGAWDQEVKGWVFSLTEKNISWLGNTLIPRGFSPDDEFVELFAQGESILGDIENHIPMLTYDNGFKIKNAHRKIPQPENLNLIESLFWARNFGITAWDDEIDKKIDQEIDFLTRSLLRHNSKKTPLWFNCEEVAIDGFENLLKHGGRAIVIVPGGNEIMHMKQWNELCQRIGIKNSEISVLFRLPNEQADFNHYVKEQELNNPIDEDTRMVFVSTKITKPLIKSGVKFNTVINLGYYNYMHFSMSTVVDNARNLVYYSMKEPVQNKRWQQHEL